MKTVECTVKPTLFFYAALTYVKIINLFSNKKSDIAYKKIINAVNNKPDLFVRVKTRK